MAHENFKRDPAIDRFNNHRESAHLRFRWNRSTARTGLLGFIVVPGLMYYIASKTDGRWDWNGKLKGEPLARNP